MVRRRKWGWDAARAEVAAGNDRRWRCRGCSREGTATTSRHPPGCRPQHVHLRHNIGSTPEWAENAVSDRTTRPGDQFTRPERRLRSTRLHRGYTEIDAGAKNAPVRRLAETLCTSKRPARRLAENPEPPVRPARRAAGTPCTSNRPGRRLDLVAGDVVPAVRRPQRSRTGRRPGDRRPQWKRTRRPIGRSRATIEGARPPSGRSDSTTGTPAPRKAGRVQTSRRRARKNLAASTVVKDQAIAERIRTSRRRVPPERDAEIARRPGRALRPLLLRGGVADPETSVQRSETPAAAKSASPTRPRSVTKDGPPPSTGRGEGWAGRGGPGAVRAHPCQTIRSAGRWPRKSPGERACIQSRHRTRECSSRRAAASKAPRSLRYPRDRERREADCKWTNLSSEFGARRPAHGRAVSIAGTLAPQQKVRGTQADREPEARHPTRSRWTAPPKATSSPRSSPPGSHPARPVPTPTPGDRCLAYF